MHCFGGGVLYSHSLSVTLPRILRYVWLMKSCILFLRLIWHIQSLIPITVGLWLHMDHLWLVLSVSLSCMLRHTYRRNNIFGYNHLSKLMCLCFYISEYIEVHICGKKQTYDQKEVFHVCTSEA